MLFLTTYYFRLSIICILKIFWLHIMRFSSVWVLYSFGLTFFTPCWSVLSLHVGLWTSLCCSLNSASYRALVSSILIFETCSIFVLWYLFHQCFRFLSFFELDISSVLSLSTRSFVFCIRYNFRGIWDSRDTTYFGVVLLLPYIGIFLELCQIIFFLLKVFIFWYTQFWHFHFVILCSNYPFCKAFY